MQYMAKVLFIVSDYQWSMCDVIVSQQ